MRRAIELAERGRGTTYPNPLVGAVVVCDGEVVGEGWHERRGEPHAEVNALRAAGERARGSTMYVSLEPCTHHGSTPPCVDAILEAGVERVVVGARDPNPNVSGGGVERLRGAGGRRRRGVAGGRGSTSRWSRASRRGRRAISTPAGSPCTSAGDRG